MGACAHHTQTRSRARGCGIVRTYVDVCAYVSVARAREIAPVERSRFGRDRSAPSGRRVARVWRTRAQYVYERIRIDAAAPPDLRLPAVTAPNRARRRTLWCSNSLCSGLRLRSSPYGTRPGRVRAQSITLLYITSRTTDDDEASRVYDYCDMQMRVSGKRDASPRKAGARRPRARIGGVHSISGGSVRGTPRWWARFAKSDALTEMRGAASYGRSSRSYRRIAACPDWPLVRHLLPGCVSACA